MLVPSLDSDFPQSPNPLKTFRLHLRTRMARMGRISDAARKTCSDEHMFYNTHVDNMFLPAALSFWSLVYMRTDYPTSMATLTIVISGTCIDPVIVANPPARKKASSSEFFFVIGILITPFPLC